MGTAPRHWMLILYCRKVYTGLSSWEVKDQWKFPAPAPDQFRLLLLLLPLPLVTVTLTVTLTLRVPQSKVGQPKRAAPATMISRTHPDHFFFFYHRPDLEPGSWAAAWAGQLSCGCLRPAGPWRDGGGGRGRPVQGLPRQGRQGGRGPALTTRRTQGKSSNLDCSFGKAQVNDSFKNNL